MVIILDKIVEVLKEAKSIAVLPHISADGDSLGSSLALSIVLKNMGKEVLIYAEEDIPYIYNFLPGLDLVRVGTSSQHYDVIIALDTGDMGRLGTRGEMFSNNTPVTINVDHHNTNSKFALYNYVESSSAAVGEIVYDMIGMLGESIDTDIATCLYVAITTDTGGFRYSNTTVVTHKIAADLINYGVNVAEVSQRVFETTSIEKVRLTGQVINSLQLLEDGKVALIEITDEMMMKAGAKDEDCDGVVNIGRNVKGVEVAVMLRQKSNGDIKVNLRSNSYVDVSAVAAKYSGGGHKRASGCIIKSENKESLIQDIIDRLN